MKIEISNNIKSKVTVYWIQNSIKFVSDLWHTCQFCPYYHILQFLPPIRVRVMVFDATFNNISAISWRPVLLVEETGVAGENHQPVCKGYSLSHNVVSSTPCLSRVRTRVGKKPVNTSIDRAGGQYWF